MRIQESPRKKSSPPPVKAPPTNGNGSDDSHIDMRDLLRVLQAVRDGDFSVRLPGDRTGLAGKIADTFNDIVTSNEQMARELARVGQVVGKEGKTRQRVSIKRRGGAWDAIENSVNTLIEDL